MEFVEASVIEDQQKTAPIWTQPLYGVWNAWRKQPQVAFAHVVHKASAELIYGCDARVAVEHNGPFRLNVPVKFTNSTRGKPHFNTGDVFRDRQIADGHLTRPTASLNSLAR